MAKGLRSKIKRVFRAQKRSTVSQAPWHLEGDARKQEILKEILEAPKPTPNDPSNDDPSCNKMEIDALDDLPPLTTKNPAKLARKLKERRLAASRGIVPGQKKKAKPLAGANQFHKKMKKTKRR